MQPKRASLRITLIDVEGGGDRRGAEIIEALSRAGYDVACASEGDRIDDDVDLVLRIVDEHERERVRSGILHARTLRSKSDVPSTTKPLGTGKVAGDGRLPFDAQLRHTERMDAIAQLAGGVAHDFNNVLSVVSICTDELRDALGGDDSEDSNDDDDEQAAANRECLVDIRHAVDRGVAITRDLLAFSQRDLRDPRVVDFNELVTDSERTLERILGEDIALHLSLDAKNALVRVDPSQWASVFINLALNARHAMMNGGDLTVRTTDHAHLDPRKRGHDKPAGRYVELEVTDTGSGIGESILHRIFEPFFTTKDDGKASGLGLAVVHGIVERCSGFIDVSSRARDDNAHADSGTTFRIFVPAEAKVATTPGDDDASSNAKKKKKKPTKSDTPLATLMLVEDEDALRRVAHKTLERQGYRVFQAGSAEEALEMMAGKNFPAIDLLITDVVLPGKNGRELAAEILARSGGDDGGAKKQPEVLYTSGYTDDEVIRFGVERSELYFLPKPYTTKLLVARVEEVLNRKRK